PEVLSDDEIKRRQDEQALLVSRAFSVPAIDFDLAVDRVASISGAPASVESAEATDAKPEPTSSRSMGSLIEGVLAGVKAKSAERFKVERQRQHAIAETMGEYRDRVNTCIVELDALLIETAPMRLLLDQS